MHRRTFLTAIGATAATAAAGQAAGDGRFKGVADVGATQEGTIAKMLFGSTSGVLAPDMTPLSDDSLVAVYAEPEAEVRDRDDNGDAVTYPDDLDIPLVCVDGSVVGLGAMLVNDGDLVPELAGEDPLADLGNEEFVLNCYDEFVDGDTILWDDSHGQFYDLGRFKNFSAYAESNGYTLVATSDLDADFAGALSEADGVVITSPSDSFSDEELTALSDFADGGGGVFLHDQSDFSDFDATANLNDVASGLDLGFRFNDGEVGDTENNIGIGYLPLTSNFNTEAFDLFADREGIVVDIQRGQEYDVAVESVADGDTFDVVFDGEDVGLQTDYTATVRVLGVDTPESASVAAAAERPEEWEGLAYDIDASSLRRLQFDSAASLLAEDMTPLTDDSTVVVTAEPTAENEDSDGNGDAVSYPPDTSIPLVAVEGSVMGLGAPFVNDGSYAAALDNEEFLLNAYDELVGGGTVLWDESHGQFYSLDKFGQFESIAADNGYTLEGSSDLTADLSDADGVVITSPSDAFTDEELTALSDFADAGGAVFLHDQSDFNDFDATANLNEVAAALDLSFRFNDDQVVDDENNAGRFFIPTTTQFDESSPYFGQRPGSDGSEGENTTPHLVEWAGKATDFAFEVLDGETVTLSFDENEPLRDPTRLLAYAEYDGDGGTDTLYNKKLIEEGYARVYGSSMARHDEFWAAENVARQEGRGLWAESDVSTATPYRDGFVGELFVPDARGVRSAEGSLADGRIPLYSEDTSSPGEAPLAALDEDDRVALVGGPIIDESYEADEGFPLDTSDYDNFAFLTALIDYLSDRDGDVLVDGGHGQFGAGYTLSSEDAAYYQRHLEGRGINLEQVNDPTPEKLDRGRAYLVTTPVSEFTDAELDAVRSFRDSGGAVVLLGSAAAPESATTNLQSVAAGLGTDLRFDDPVEDPENNLNDDPTVPTTTNLDYATAAVDGPVDHADEDDDQAIDTSELRSAISDWASGEYETDQLRDIIEAWASS
ncbi:ABC transporter [Halobacteriales archaeon QS_8_69_26]|nr:MAG: ABC transporter [Halobacteriales archaeon QS_8_69_26]